MSMFNDIDWIRNGNSKESFSNSQKGLGHWSFLGLGEEEEWYGTQNYKLEGPWNSTADVMVANIEDSGHPFFRAGSLRARL